MLLRITFIVLLMMPFFASSQKLVDKIKRKHYGVYVGTIPGYQIETDQDLVNVESTTIEIEISEKHVSIQIGDQKVTGTYTVLFKGDNYYVLDVTVEGQEANDRIVVYQRGKKISRDGMFPQPNTMLDKLSKKELKDRE